jgi:hypothetical protein
MPPGIQSDIEDLSVIVEHGKSSHLGGTHIYAIANGVIDHDVFGDSGMVPAGFGVERTQEHVITEVAL